MRRQKSGWSAQQQVTISLLHARKSMGLTVQNLACHKAEL